MTYLPSILIYEIRNRHRYNLDQLTISHQKALKISATLISIVICGLSAIGQPSNNWSINDVSSSHLIEDIGQCAAFENQYDVDVQFMMYGNSVVYYIHDKGFSVQKVMLNSARYHEQMEAIEQSFEADLSYEEHEEIEKERSQEVFLDSKDSSTAHFWNSGFDLISAENEDQTAALFHFNGFSKNQLTSAKEFTKVSCLDKKRGP
ncbi:MAG: hypothetical protein Salg2KO_10480 [Salibacteraceae bacterium]